jgi:uncharacterized protein YndB with AHSA1/START domain
MTTIDPEPDLSIQRIIRAPRDAVWRAWTEADQLERWWIPAPTLARVELLDLRPGGGFVTRMSEDGVEYSPHLDAVFLVVEPGERLVFTNAIDSGWHPASPVPVAMVAEILFGEHPEGTEYRAVVRHRDPASRAHHEELGFFDGWGAVTEALAMLVENEA